MFFVFLLEAAQPSRLSNKTFVEPVVYYIVLRLFYVPDVEHRWVATVQKHKVRTLSITHHVVICRSLMSFVAFISVLLRSMHSSSHHSCSFYSVCLFVLGRYLQGACSRSSSQIREPEWSSRRPPHPQCRTPSRTDRDAGTHATGHVTKSVWNITNRSQNARAGGIPDRSAACSSRVH